MKTEEQSTIALLSEYDLIDQRIKLLLEKRELIRKELVYRLPTLEVHDEFKPKKLILDKENKYENESNI